MGEAARDDTSGLVDHYFRHTYGQLVSTLARRFGTRVLETCEDAVQEALVAALTSWSLRGLPDDPTGWLYRVAHNRVLDRLRRAQAWERRVERGDVDCAPSGVSLPDVFLSHEIVDDQLRMLFVCCDPALPMAAQLALALKILCGFSVAEIARRLFTTEANVYKRLARGRAWLAEQPRALDTPPDLALRLPAVHAVLYLVFNEGYGAAQDDALVRDDLCQEALRLAHLLVSHPAGDTPATRALVALMHLHAARLPTRVDAAGSLLTLADQDRTAWDHEHVRCGLAWLHAAIAEDVCTRYHLEAAIAAEHVTAPSFGATRWLDIANLYLALDRVAPSPLNHLNRAVAIAEVHGAASGLAALDGVRLPPGIAGYYLWDAVVGDLYRRAGDAATARTCLARALRGAPTTAEQELIRARLAACVESAFGREQAER